MGGALDDGYRLHALRTMREREENERKTELAEAVATTGRAQALVDEADRAVQAAATAERDHVRSAADRAAQGVGVADMLGDRHYRDRLIAAIAEAEQAAIDARDNLVEVKAEEQATRDRLAEAVRERKAVDVHYEKFQAERKRDRARKDETDADDIAQMLHRRDREEE